MNDESIQTAMFWMLLVPASVSLWAIVGFFLYLIYLVFTDDGILKQGVKDYE